MSDLFIIFKAAVQSVEAFIMSPTLVLSVVSPGTLQALWLVNSDQSGYIACATID